MLYRLILITFLLTSAQILRVYLLNLIAKPYFVIGIRDAMFMNAAGFLLNVVSPFRAGELFRYVFLRYRIETASPVILGVLFFERILDVLSISLISILFLNIDGLLVLIIAICFLLSLILKSKKLKLNFDKFEVKQNFFTYIFLFKKFFENITWVNFQKILVTNFFIWFLYCGSVLAIDEIKPGLFTNWVSWSFSPFRGLGSLLFPNDPYYNVNTYFVIPILIVGFAISLFPHLNSYYLNWIKGGISNYANVGSYKSNTYLEKRKDFKYILKTPLKIYRDQLIREKKDLYFFHGGSGALIFTEKDSLCIKKVGFGLQREKLCNQYKFMQENAERWNFPTVRSGVGLKHGYEYQIERIVDGTRIDEYLSSSSIGEKEVVRCMEKIYDFIERDRTHLKEKLDAHFSSMTFQQLWNVKVEQNLKDLKILVPEYFEFKLFKINDRNLISLDLMALKIKKISEQLIFRQNTKQVHGDLTFSNLFMRSMDETIMSIDPNPFNQLKSTSVDHGKVLQSIWANYENLMSSSHISKQYLNFIEFEEEKSLGYELALKWYESKLIKSELNLLLESQIMCFVHLVRLLPYRISTERSKSAVFFARTLQIGQKIIDDQSN